MNQIQSTDAAGAKELDLARDAAAGDGAAFALLYDAYEQRIFNFCLRILGNKHDAEDATQDAFVRMLKRLPEMDTKDVEFGPYLFTTARNVTYDMIGKRKTAQPVEEIPETGEGHLHRDDIDIDLDPERAAMAGSQAMSVQEANQRLPERQREVLVLREVEEMSYDDIASTMGMNSNSVAQLISRARTRLRSEMRLGSAAAVAPSSPDCEKALPLLAMRQDGELGPADDESWLGEHLAGCSTCRLADEEMAEAGISYRAWTPILPAAYLFRDTLAKASDSVGADWSGVARPSTSDSGVAATSGAAGISGRTMAIAAGGALVLVVFVSAVLAGGVSDSSRVARNAIDTANPLTLEARAVKKVEKKLAKKKNGSQSTVVDPVTGEVVPVSEFRPDNPRRGSNRPNRSNQSNGGNNGGGNNGGGNTQPNPRPNPQPEPVPEPEPDPPVTDPPVVTPPDPPDPPIPGGPGIPGGPTPG